MTLWGLHMAMAQGSRPAMVADTVPGDLRGMASWFFNLMSAVAADRKWAGRIAVGAVVRFLHLRGRPGGQRRSSEPTVVSFSGQENIICY